MKVMMMLWKMNIIVVIYCIVGLNANEIDVNNREANDGNFNVKDFKTRRIAKEISAERMREQYRRRSDSILDEEVKWLNANEMYNFGGIEMLLKERNMFDETLVPVPSKKASTSRLCGTKLVEAIIKLCNGCVKPVGAKAVSVKRLIVATATLLMI
ncbi:unnamed protein product [Litomosoides sigmodontis]|uniref:Uncharacterized protein n=1 Tax=Litomosoides sigmodontis TaxID=42156 RepID=A0A3P6SCC7_LITSI|nr:unnamed protein product [Litomosoides sigmodontis]